MTNGLDAPRPDVDEPLPTTNPIGGIELADAPASTTAEVVKADGPEAAGDDGAMLAGAEVAVAMPAGFTMPLADLGAAIGDIYWRHLQRRASFEEVLGWLERLRDGTTLPTMISAIADSAEAVALDLKRGRRHRDRGTFDPELQILYRATLGRPPRAEETDQWFKAHVDGLSLALIAERIQISEEAAIHRRVIGVSDGVFIQMAIEIVAQRGASIHDIARLRADLDADRTTRSRLWSDLFAERVERELNPAAAHRNDTDTAWIAGVDRHVDRGEWNRRRAAHLPLPPRPIARFPFHPPADDTPLVSIITSLFRGGDFIDYFLDNLAGQTIFAYCELIIVDAASDQGEEAKIRSFANGRSNIVYLRTPERIGIYRAWNMAVARARGRYLTNANLDDSRRRDSIEIQAATLDALPFVDVVTQDVSYSFEPNLPFDEIARAGVRASFVNADPYTLMTHNPPHNAPMWRRSLHDEIGAFDERYRSAADFDFWLRCAAAGKVFYGIADPHVGYFYNPDGLSTSSAGIATAELETLRLRNFRTLIAPAFLDDDQMFAARLGPARPDPEVEPDIPLPEDQDPLTNHRYRLVQRALLGMAADAAKGERA